MQGLTHRPRKKGFIPRIDKFEAGVRRNDPLLNILGICVGRFSGEAVPPEVIAGITAELLLSRTAAIACDLAVLLAWRGALEKVEEAAQELAPSAARRVFLIPMIRLAATRDAGAGARIAAMLPEGHRAVRWALGGRLGRFSETMLDDLGDPASVAQILPYLRPDKEK